MENGSFLFIQIFTTGSPGILDVLANVHSPNLFGKEIGFLHQGFHRGSSQWPPLVNHQPGPGAGPLTVLILEERKITDK